MIIETTSPEANPATAPDLDRPQRVDPEVVAAVAVSAAIFVILASAALRSSPTYDIGLAHAAGEVAWMTGRPESLDTWISTPFLGATMAVTSRLMSVTTAAWWLTVVNIAICLTVTVALLWTLRERLSRTQLWTLALAMGVFMPALSSIWWKQFNLLALGAAAIGWLYVRRGDIVVAGGLFALSVAIKPLLILLPLLLLLKTDLRRAGAWTIVFLGGLVAVSKAFLAWRASDVAVLSPMADIRNFSDASRPENIWSCHPENLSPGAYLCRLSGPAGFQVQRALVAVGVLLLAFALWEALSRRAATDWAWFAGVCTLSPMISPIAWTHYQVLLAPALVLLFLELASPPRSSSNVLLIGAAFAACSVSLQPYGSLPGQLGEWLGGSAETPDHLFSVLTVAATAQWIVLLLLFQLRGRPSVLGPRDLNPATAPQEGDR